MKLNNSKLKLYPSGKPTPELQILNDIINSVKNDQICEEYKTTPESPELIENICKTLIKNDDFRVFFKDLLHECSECSMSTNSDEKRIKVYVQLWSFATVISEVFMKFYKLYDKLLY